MHDPAAKRRKRIIVAACAVAAVFFDGAWLSGRYGGRFGIAALFPAAKQTSMHVRDHFLSLSRDSAGEWRLAADDDPNPVVFKFAQTQVNYFGPWAPFERSELHMACYDGQLGNTANVRSILAATILYLKSADEEAIDTRTIRSLEAINATPSPLIAASYVTSQRSETLWSGLGHVALLGVSFGVLMAVGAAALGDRVRASRRRARAERNHCPACDYDLAGLSVMACPECGQPIRSRAPQNNTKL